ncbi:MAG TPA: OFA family MFS transporter [Alphaproteobacteria bacterium]|nr:OFA family MFS transporter [Alphaproteobacteria bacterium]
MLFSKIKSLLSRERTVAPEGFNRWRVPPASIAIHLCIGSVYSWSVLNPGLTRTLGVVVPAPDDWSLSSVVWVFSVAICALGLSAAFAGKWLERVGPRMVGVVAAACRGGGFIVGGVGILTHQLWLLYLGYGVLGGCGLGLAYVSPVTTLIRWFPDRRGMASGMAIMGFGGGAMLAVPFKEWLIGLYYQAPAYLGALSDVSLVTQGGRRFAQTAEGLREVVVVGASDVAAMVKPGPEGVYVLGTGDAGVMGAFFTLGVVYFIVMTGAAFAFRLPRDGWAPAGWVPPTQAQMARKMMTTRHVTENQALRTPQFYLLWLVLCLNVTAGICVLSVAKTMIHEIFGSALPTVVTGSFAATYVMAISLFNMGGRFAWASASDWIGRKRTYVIFFVAGILLYLTIPYTAAQVAKTPSVGWLVLFYAATMAIFTMYGGGFATMPAYLSDIFGTRYLGGIQGRILTAWSTAGVLGPALVMALRDRARGMALHDLAAKADPAAFAARFGAGVDQLEALIAAKTVTIGSLLEICPPGTPDPTGSLYDTTMVIMAGLLAVALVANLMVRPVSDRHFAAEEQESGLPDVRRSSTGRKDAA